MGNKKILNNILRDATVKLYAVSSTIFTKKTSLTLKACISRI